MAANNKRPPSPLPAETSNKAIVATLYKALALGDRVTVARLVASDLEWWFHGPPQCQHMMRVLTGESDHAEFRFEPRSLTALGDGSVIVEGWEGADAYWVHAWSLKGGLIVQLREYFNTWLVVTDVRPGDCEVGHDSFTLWQSQPRDLFSRSLPGLVLAI